MNGGRIGAHRDWRPVHLITTDLWDAITGERASAAAIVQFCDLMMCGGGAAAAMSSQYFSMAKDRQGSRVLQQKIADGTAREREAIFEALMPRLDDLVFDPSSNYVVQRLFEVAAPHRENEFLCFFLADVRRIVEHQTGCRVLQKFVEHASTASVDRLFVELREDLVQLCYGQNGNHIVQRFVDLLVERRSEIVCGLRGHLAALSQDSCGCRVVQRLFEVCAITDLRPLVEELMESAVDLAMNQYGNYVIQHIISEGPEDDVATLLRAFTGYYHAFSTHKFASNVIEKCITRASPRQREKLFEEVLGNSSRVEERRIAMLAGDQFGNYVIQRALEFGMPHQIEAIHTVVSSHYDELVRRPYARHVIVKLEQLGRAL